MTSPTLVVGAAWVRDRRDSLKRVKRVIIVGMKEREKEKSRKYKMF